MTKFQHRQIRAVRKSLTTESVKTLVHPLIASRLDYCNGVFYQLSAANLQALQSVLNAGARLITRKRKYDHITSTLRDDLHWLPIRQWILYKRSTIVYKCIHGAAPSYLTNLCVPVATNISRRYLRSATHGNLLVGRERWPMDHEALLFLVLLSGTLCHRPYVHRPPHSDSFRVD